jgi:hypothetical protein
MASDTVDNVISNVTRHEDKDQHIAAGFRTLSPDQIEGVDAFLSFIARQTRIKDWRLRRRMQDTPGGGRRPPTNRLLQSTRGRPASS